MSQEPGCYRAEQVAGLLGLTLAQIRGYVRSGVIVPERGARGELRFSFQDLVFLRVVKELAHSRVPPRRVREALRRLRSELPADRPLSGVRLSAEGDDVVVRDEDRTWSPATGQYWLEFGTGEGTRPPVLIRSDDASGGGESPLALTASADGWYALGAELEDIDPEQARLAYRQALALDPTHADSHVNLGCLEHEAGRPREAEQHYRAALAVRPDDATAAFDLGVALEDLERLDEARAAYERALSAATDCADAHYNLARLLDRLGDPQQAIHHLRAYRTLVPR
jgi:tetratricopeptide (TPR) repeat protein